MATRILTQLEIDVDALSEASSKLFALLANTYGEAGDSFRNLNVNLQDCYLWACCDLAREIHGLVDESVDRKVAASKEAGHG